jgi:hypothetical protein
VTSTLVFLNGVICVSNIISIYQFKF